jgi:hypothetical protein
MALRFGYPSLHNSVYSKSEFIPPNFSSKPEYGINVLEIDQRAIDLADIY